MTQEELNKRTSVTETMHNGHEGGRVNIINSNWNKSTKLKTE